MVAPYRGHGRAAACPVLPALFMSARAEHYAWFPGVDATGRFEAQAAGRHVNRTGTSTLRVVR